jgi:methyl-accepting chemotaxis protein
MSETREQNRPFRRRRFLVDGRQYHLLGFVAVYFCAIVITYAVGVFVPLVFQVSGSSISSLDLGTAADEFLALHGPVWPLLIVVLVFLVVHGIVISHRLSGPLYRMRAYLKALSDGDLSRTVKFRTKDYLAPEADSINQMVSTMRTRVIRIKEEHARATEAAVKVRQTAASGSMAEAVRHADTLMTALADLKLRCDAFETGTEQDDDNATASQSEAVDVLSPV